MVGLIGEVGKVGKVGGIGMVGKVGGIGMIGKASGRGKIKKDKNYDNDFDNNKDKEDRGGRKAK